MTRLRTDQACLEAQMQQQIAQNLNAELAVPCPDCGVESGRACRDSLDRAVRTHLARSVAANRRDTEPCPAPMAPDEARAFVAEQVSLTRAAAREFYEQVAADADRAIRETLQSMPLTLDEFLQTPTASDCAPSPAASAPDAVAFYGPGRIVSERTDELGRVHREVERPKHPTCACGQTIWAGSLDGPSPSMCADCEQELDRNRPHVLTLDERIEAAKPETKSDDATECAWSTPTSEGEGWT